MSIPERAILSNAVEQGALVCEKLKTTQKQDDDSCGRYLEVTYYVGCRHAQGRILRSRDINVDRGVTDIHETHKRNVVQLRVAVCMPTQVLQELLLLSDI
jgi:hypothetical protein